MEWQRAPVQSGTATHARGTCLKPMVVLRGVSCYESFQGAKNPEALGVLPASECAGFAFDRRNDGLMQ